MAGEGVALLEREEPRARLEAALAAARRGRGGVLSIEGEAGIGKTALTLDFVEAHRDDVRIHMGGCEHLTTAEPFGPLRDIARESQGRFSLSSAGPLATYEAVLRLLSGGRGPALLVIEDIHWADDATLDLIRYLGRRVRAAPVLVIVTCRNDEPGSVAALGSLWADIPRDVRERMELRPLSLQAVSSLARGAGRRGQDIYALAGGNPFHVTEYLASAPDAVPRGVQDATLARAASLSPLGRRVLDCAAIFPRQIDEATLRILSGDLQSEGVEECLRVGMLQERSGALAFRHELARRAILDAISPLRCRELHFDALALLKGRNDGRAAEAAHHAAGAQATEDLVRYSIRAAEEAAALGAYRQAVAHLATALAHGSWLPDRERVHLLERQAEAGEHCGAFDTAVPAIEAAIEAARKSGDSLSLGNALRISARLQWLLGDTERADEISYEAIQVLEAHPDNWQFAMALSGQSQLDMLADRIDRALRRSEEAMGRARRLGRWDIYLHALTNFAAARCSVDIEAGIAQLLAAIEEAKQLEGGLDAVPRLYSNLAFVMSHSRRYAGLLEHCDAAIEACVARDNIPVEGYIRGFRAQVLLDFGRFEEAIAAADHVLHGPYPKGAVRFPALLAASRARVRLGLPEDGAIEEARALPTSRRDLMRLAPLAVADAEAVYVGEVRHGAVDRLRAVYETMVKSGGESWVICETALWLKILDAPVILPDISFAPISRAQELHIAGDWRGAADAWAEKGCPYEQAIALSEGNEAGKREALAIFDRIRAHPAARKLRRAMRAQGLRAVPSGPRTARRNDAAGLTPRQNEVLQLLVEGCSNSEIAHRLSTSAKTVEHHVGAILVALEAPNRLRAVQIARERRLVEI